ncbi:hypothetical protein ACQP1G_16925 [Nocardia sp. CA-107356]|uniref:hypothetical protein n=1 Tax=Nocardia sp. CA-107356 TaxID=3239972 RepID=UPI003D8FA727
MSAPRFADRAADRCRHYRHVCGLDAFLLEGTGPIYLRAGNTGAIRMPAKLGEPVRARLAHPGPVIVELDDTSEAWWTMLTTPVHHHLRDYAIFAMLSAATAQIVPYGHEVRLPTPRDRSCRWLATPTDSYRPSPDDVVTAIRAYRYEG